jgi:hypothetical protein
MVEAAKIIGNLEQARRLAFPVFDQITLEPGAVQVLINLFLHPGCKSDVNLAQFLTGQPVQLSAISPHIITAFPSQVASYATRRGITTISAADLLECFALDHTDAVEENQRLLGMEPSYALAHVLTIGTVAAVQQVALRQLCTVQVTVCQEPATFTHVLVPTYLSAPTGSTVFHHFGVVVQVATTRTLQQLARRLQRQQDQKSFMQRTIRQVLGADVRQIDYAKQAYFKVDMAGNIIRESKKDVNFQKLWQEDDLRKIKFPKEAKVMFAS